MNKKNTTLTFGLILYIYSKEKITAAIRTKSQQKNTMSVLNSFLSHIIHQPRTTTAIYHEKVELKECF
jgi:hypothetical protein